MNEQIQNIENQLSSYEFKASEDIEKFRIQFLGSKGLIKGLYALLRDVPNDKKKSSGQLINALKQKAESMLDAAKKNQTTSSSKKTHEDLTKPAPEVKLGSHHPLSIIRREIVDVFRKIGFSISEGPEIEDDWHNFSALNFPPEHPARDMQDTFFIQTNPDILLRTHTSSVQVRHMENNQPPIRTISPGRVFRNEAISSRSHCIFHQIEGLYIAKDVSFADLKQTLKYFTEALFGNSKIRLRPSYFPFTEPSAEVDIYWGLDTETDYRITKGTGWLEIMGCGMVDPNVLKNCDIDPEEYSGFAFGMGIERIAMLLYQVSDIRLFFENDVRFLKQFKSTI
jgi:phenylalanyl-tRNA synthetase alpha chain